MEDISVLISKLERFEAALLGAGQSIAEEMAISAKALIVARVQREGLPDADYSTKLMLATESMFTNKSNFKPTQVGTRLGYDKEKKEVIRNKKGTINRKETKPISLYIKFPKAKKAVPVMVIEGGYKEFRGIDGKQNAFVDLTLTGRMFQNWHIVDVSVIGTKCVATLGGLDQETKNKLQGHAEKYGDDFLYPNIEEQQILNEVAFDKINEINNSIKLFSKR
jgi:hypothetical protein